MLLRHIQQLGRNFSVKTVQSSLGGAVFSGQKLPNLLKLPQDPNPLYTLSKAQILQLKKNELDRLLKIPYKHIEETDQFCMNLLDIVQESILSDPARASFYLRAVQDPEMKSIVFECLKKFYNDDPLRWSIVAFIEDPTERTHRALIMKNLTQILTDDDKSSEVASQTALSYLTLLALTDVHNPKSLILQGKLSKRLYHSLPSHKRTALFGALVHINMRFGDGNLYDTMKNHLLKGSAIQRLVARTGLLDAKWHDVTKSGFSEAHKQKMLSFYSIGDLVLFANAQIKRKDVVLSNFYLDLMVTKFEIMGDASHLHKVLNVMIIHSMTFKGPQECIKFLKYILDSKLELKTSTLMKVLVNLTEQSCHGEALLLVNFLHTENLSENQKSYLVKEIVEIISNKFSHHPKIAIGYFASLFGTKGLQLLKDLYIIDVVYGQVSSEPLFAFIDKADIHEDLRNSTLTHPMLRNIYTNMLQSLPQVQSTSPVLIKKLYENYRSKVLEPFSTELQTFLPMNVDDSIITLFIEHLLRVNPYARNDFKLGRDNLRYQTAKYIMQDFLRIAQVKKVYLIELMVTSSLQQHHDLNFAASLIKYAKDNEMPITFNQIFPFVVFHYSKGEMDQAHKWYSLLVQSGAKSNYTDGNELIRIAKELNWPVKGTFYLGGVRRKNRKARREGYKLEEETILKLQGAETSLNEINQDGEFLEELGSVLNDIIHSRDNKGSAQEKEPQPVNDMAK